MSETFGIADLTAALAATAGGTHWVPLAFTASYEGARCAGPARTVTFERGDNLALHTALEAAGPGEVIVAAGSGPGDAGHWGGLMTRRAAERGLGGLVVDASVRDREELRARRFPVFFRSTCPRKATKRSAGSLDERVTLGGIAVAPGDLVVADEDGVVVIPAGRIEAVLAEAAAIAEQERALPAGRPLVVREP